MAACLSMLSVTCGSLTSIWCVSVSTNSKAFRPKLCDELAHAIYCQTHCQHIILQNHHNLVQTNANCLPNGRGGQLKHVANPDLQTNANCPPGARGGQLEHAHFKSKAFLKSKSLNQNCICQTPGCGDTGHPQPTNKCMEFAMGRRVPRTN